MKRWVRCASLLLGLGAVATRAEAQQLRDNCFRGCFDNWLSFQRNTDNTNRWEYQPRLYLPFNLSGGWTFIQRVDLPFAYTDQVGTANPTGAWKAGLSDWFIEEIFSTPQLARNFKLWASVRLVFPTGRSSPFGVDQYQWAPALSATYAIPKHGITFSPVARYVMSFQSAKADTSRIRQLNLYPILTFAFPKSWSIVFYPENAIVHNGVTNKWFVPVDMMLIKRMSKRIELGAGGAYALVKDDPLYDYLIYGRTTLFF